MKPPCCETRGFLYIWAMAELIYTIGGDNSGLLDATNRAIANIKNLTSSVNAANVSLQFKNGITALDALGKSLLVAQGNASLFGDSIKTQTAELSAYQTALNSLLANGFDPLGADVQRIKGQIDGLNDSIKESNSITVKNRNFTGGEPSASPGFANSVPINPSGLSGTEYLIKGLNEDLDKGVISATEYREAIENIGKNTFASSIQQASEAIETEIGYVNQLKIQLAELNEIRLNAPEDQLSKLNLTIQETEASIKQATNIGKVGFDEFGSSIKGVSVQNINGQLIALSNNLFGARQIAKDVVRTFDAGSIQGFAKAIGLLAVDFLYYAQNAQFAAGATGVATTAIAGEATVATGAAISTEALGAAFASLLTPVNLIILGIAVLGGGFLAYEKTQKTVTQAALDHAKAIKQQKQALDEFITTLTAQQQVNAKASEDYSEQITKLQELYLAVQQQITAGKDYTTQLVALQDAFPQFFANIDSATAKTDALSQAYRNAGDAIKALGLVTAASQLAQGANVDIVKNQVAADAELQNLKTLTTQYNAAKEAFKTPLSGGGGGGISVDYGLVSLENQINAAKKAIDQYNASVAAAKAQVQAFNQIAVNNQGAANSGKNSGLINGLDQQLKNLKDIEPYLKTQQQVQENISQQKAIQAQLDALEGKNAVSLLDSKSKELSIQQQIADILAKSGADAEKSGLTGYALAVADITTKYDAFYVSLDKVGQKIAQQSALFGATNGKRGLSPTQAASDTSSLNSAYGTLTENESKQLSDAQIKDAQSTSDAITKINNDFGIKQEAGYNEELARVKRLYDGIIAQANSSTQTLAQIQANYQSAISKANGDPQGVADANTNNAAQLQQYKDSQTKIAAAHADLLPAIQSIDAKYIQQEQQTYDKIVDIANQAFAVLDDGEASRTDKINLEWQKRITSANAYFDKLRDLAKASGLGQGAIDQINSTQSQVTAQLNAADFKQVSIEISKNFADAMQSATQGFVSGFYTDLTSIGATRQSIDEKYNEQIASASDQATKDQLQRIKELELGAETSFGSIFSGLVGKFEDTFNQSILNSFTKQLTENLGKTLLTPSASQLKISPEEQAAQQTALLLKNAGTSLADQIKQAGVAFYNSVTGKSGIPISSGLLSGASGGSSFNSAGLIEGGTDNVVTGQDFSNNVSSSTDTFTSAVSDSADVTTGAAKIAAQSTTSAAGNLSASLAKGAAALSLAGGLISGATSPTSTVGQGVGGALKGAGEGALIGSAFGPEGTVLGAIGGGLVGLVSGIFGASKAQKELQAEQLAEAQQQTALLKASLAYTSSIIGRDTVNGIVTGVSVGATGQLVATIAGKDLQFVLDRANNGR